MRLSGANAVKRILFILGVNLKNGAGTEHYLLNLLNSNDRTDIEITVIQTDFMTNNRLTDEEIRKMINRAQLVTISSPYKIFRHLAGIAKSINFTSANEKPTNATRVNWLVGAFLNIVPVIWHFVYEYFNLIYMIRNRGIIKQLGEFDTVYLFDNEYQLVGQKLSENVIGSTHVMIPGQTFGKMNKLVQKMISSGLLYGKIKGFHILREDPLWEFNRKSDFTIPIGVDTNEFFPEKKDNTKNKTRLLFVGQLEKWKGTQLLLDVWKNLDHRSFEFYVIGNGSMRDNILNAPDIKYLQTCSDEDLAKIYRTCDIFLFPTFGEAFPLVVLEALTSGLFVVLSDNMRGVFDEMENLGMLTYVARTADSILRVIKEQPSKNITLKKKEETYDLIKNKYDWKTVSDRLLEKLMNCD